MGSTKEELLGKYFLEVIDSRSHADVQKLYSLLSIQHSVSNFYSSGIWMQRKSGSTSFPCALSFRMVVDDLGKSAGIIVGITDERAYTNKIEEAQKDKERLKREEKLKDEFIAVASHELRTPIQPILGFAMLAKKKIMSEELAWDGVLREARRLQQLANDILDVSRIESGSLRYDIRKDKINELLYSLVDATRIDLPKEIDLRFSHEESESALEIEFDRSRITQLVTNLIANAAKFTEKGTITVRSHVVIQENQFEILVSDTGKGISEEILPILFEKFATKGHGNVQNNKGTGLGLYISKAIVEAHGGNIFAYNNDNGGATFVVRLPLSRTV
jgi:signal transduction histidine kinase